MEKQRGLDLDPWLRFHNITEQEAAEGAQVTQPTIWRWRNCRSEPKARAKARLDAWAKEYAREKRLPVAERLDWTG